MSNQPEEKIIPQADPLEQLEHLTIDGDFEPGPDDVTSPEPEAPEIPTAQVVQMVIGPLFDIFAPNWEVSDQEKELLAGAYGDLLDKYFPDMKTGPEIGAIIVTGMVIAPRIGKPMKEPEEEEGAADGDKP
jgi:hypothetical protein